MNDLNRALVDIREVRRQVARNTEFRGYGPLTLGSTAAFAVLAGLVQAMWVPAPETHPVHYAIVWSVTAIVSALLIAVQTMTRAHRMHSGMASEMILMAVEQFLPAAATGTLLTVVIIGSTSHILWILPGLWQIVYSLGIFASCRFLPRAMQASGAWYLLTGLLSISAGGQRALAPWIMATAFGVGQLMIAGILYFSRTETADEDEA